MQDNVTPFAKKGRYTDIRVAIGEALRAFPEATTGIIILFHDNHMIRLEVCDGKEAAYAGADLLRLAATEEDAI